MQRILAFCMLLLSSTARAQLFNEALERDFFRDVLGNGHMHIAEQQAGWRKDDLLKRDFASSDPDFRPTRADTLMNTFGRHRFQDLIADSATHHWQQNRLTSNTVLLKEPGFTSGMKTRDAVGWLEPFDPDWSAISRPVFWNNGRSALLKVDYTGRKIAQHTCAVWMYLFELRENRWELVSSVKGMNCVTD